jgi:hypothetical protein
MAPVMPIRSSRTEANAPHFAVNNSIFCPIFGQRLSRSWRGQSSVEASVATAFPKPIGDPDRSIPEPQHLDTEALCEENKQLKELVVQLSKLVVKYVVERH